MTKDEVEKPQSETVEVCINEVRPHVFASALSRLRDGGSVSFEADGVHLHVWFDAGVARTDYGTREPDSGEFQVVVSTSPDKLNLRPRGRVLAEERFRYADPRQRGAVISSAEGWMRRQVGRHRGRVAGRAGVREPLNFSSPGWE
jgi:hypothetical protein